MSGSAPVTCTGQTEISRSSAVAGPSDGGDWIDKLSVEDFAALRPLLSPVDLHAGQALFQAGDTLRQVDFLQSGLVSITQGLPGGETKGVQLISRGEAVGLDALFDPRPQQVSAKALTPGRALRCPTGALATLCRERPGLTFALAENVSTQVRSLQAEVTCCTHHSVEQRLARLLLEVSARLEADIIPVTQEELAQILGVQRTTVSTLAGGLKASKTVFYLRGSIRISDRHRLTEIACGCQR